MNFMSTRSCLALICFCHLLWIGALFFGYLENLFAHNTFDGTLLFGLCTLSLVVCAFLMKPLYSVGEFIYLLGIGCLAAPSYVATLLHYTTTHGFLNIRGVSLLLIELLLISSLFFDASPEDKVVHALKSIFLAAFITLLFVLTFYIPKGVL